MGQNAHEKSGILFFPLTLRGRFLTWERELLLIEIFLLFPSLYLNYIELEFFERKLLETPKKFDSFNACTTEIPLFPFSISPIDFCEIPVPFETADGVNLKGSIHSSLRRVPGCSVGILVVIYIPTFTDFYLNII